MNPINLPCNCMTICKHHYDDAIKHNQSPFTCLSCNQHFAIPNQKFDENRITNYLIEIEQYLNCDEKQFKVDLTKSLIGIGDSLSKFSLKVNNMKLEQSDHFAKIRQEIIVRREAIMQQVHDIGYFKFIMNESTGNFLFFIYRRCFKFAKKLLS